MGRRSGFGAMSKNGKIGILVGVLVLIIIIISIIMSKSSPPPVAPPSDTVAPVKPVINNMEDLIASNTSTASNDKSFIVPSLQIDYLNLYFYNSTDSNLYITDNNNKNILVIPKDSSPASNAYVTKLQKGSSTNILSPTLSVIDKLTYDYVIGHLDKTMNISNLSKVLCIIGGNNSSLTFSFNAI